MIERLILPNDCEVPNLPAGYSAGNLWTILIGDHYVEPA
jgi:hypothetical protein